MQINKDKLTKATKTLHQLRILLSDHEDIEQAMDLIQLYGAQNAREKIGKIQSRLDSVAGELDNDIRINLGNV